jgi:hypothetical protein
MIDDVDDLLINKREKKKKKSRKERGEKSVRRTFIYTAEI